MSEPQNLTLPGRCQCDFPEDAACHEPPTQEDLLCDECRNGCQRAKRSIRYYDVLAQL